MKSLKWVLLSATLLLLGCGQPDDDKADKNQRVQQRDTGKNLAARLAEASTKGHLLGVLMKAIQFRDQLRSEPVARSKKDREQAMRIRISDVTSGNLEIQSLPLALVNLRRIEQQKLDPEWNTFWRSQAKWSLDSDPRYILNSYLDFFKDGESLSTLTLLGVPHQCSHLPNQFTIIRDWRICLHPLDGKSTDRLLGAGQYGATLAQALFFKDNQISGDFSSESTRPYLEENFELLRDKMRDPRPTSGTLTKSDRDALLGAWLEVSEKREAVDTMIDSTMFRKMLVDKSLDQIIEWLVAELTDTKNLVSNISDDDPRYHERYEASFLNLSAYNKRAAFTLGAAINVRFNTPGELNTLTSDLMHDPDYSSSLRKFSNSLVHGLIAYWNGDQKREEVSRAALAELPESDTKHLLEEKLKAALEIAGPE